MKYYIRTMEKEDFDLLEDFLYEAIYVPEGVNPPPRAVIYIPELQKYISDFGKSEHDIALIAEIDGKIVGAIWARITDDYGHIEEDIPSLAMSLYKNYRGKGIGTELLNKFIFMVKEKGYRGISLSVQKENYAVKMYKKAGFNVVDENEEEYIMAIYFE